MATAFDSRGNKRGRCLVCLECKEFETWDKNVRCAYCDCPPTKHEYCVAKESISAPKLKEEVLAVVSAEPEFVLDTPSTSPCQENQLGPPNNVFVQSPSPALSIPRQQDPTASTKAQEEGEQLGELGPKRILKGKRGDSNLKCPICRKKFSKTRALKSHVLLHRGKKHFKCSSCSKVFSDFSTLLRHKREHRSQNQSENPVSEAAPKEIAESSTSGQNKPVQRSKQKTIDPTRKSAASKRIVAPNYQNGVNLWSTPAQNAFLMSPLTGGFLPQVSIPTPPLLQPSTSTHLNRNFPIVQGQGTPQAAGNSQPETSTNQKILHMLQGLDEKLNSLSQVDRKLDFVLHYLNVPRQTVHEAPHFTFESEQAASQLEVVSQTMEETLSTQRIHAYEGKTEFERGSFDPYKPIPDNVLDEVYKASVSRRNLAKNLVFLLFNADELRGRNCAGKVYGKCSPKERLNSAKLHAVKSATFKKYPCDPLQMDAIWQRECVKAIDKAIRSRSLTNRL